MTQRATMVAAAIPGVISGRGWVEHVRRSRVGLGRRQAVVAAVVATSLIGAGCATATPYNPWRIAQDEFYGRVKTIALAPVMIFADVDHPDSVKSRYDELLAAKLREAGFSIVPSREFGEVWNRMSAEVGGLFDPVTGKRDDAKFKAVREHTVREIGTKFKTDAVLYPSIGVVKANFMGVQARWDGTSEVILTGGPAWLMNWSGTVGALSLAVAIEDRNGVPAYLNRGGIQVMSKVSFTPFVGSKFVPVERHELLANEERNTAAVNIALEPLLRQPSTSDAPKPQP